MRLALPNTAGTVKLLFAACYFSEGAPIGFIWWALPTKLHAAGVSVETTASISALLVLPWVFKFLWAPIIDICRSARWGYRAWILTLQLFMGTDAAPSHDAGLQRPSGSHGGFSVSSCCDCCHAGCCDRCDWQYQLFRHMSEAR